MKQQPTLNWLIPLLAILALVVVGTGLFWQDGNTSFTFTTLHGQTVEMYGSGLYRHDTLFTAAAFRGTDAVTLFVALPLLIFAFWLYKRGSSRGGFLLTAMLSYFLYNAAHMAFAAAYNNLFLVYIAYFSVSFFAFILAFTAVNLEALPGKAMAGRGPAVFLFIAGLAPLFLWGSELIVALLQNEAPPLLGSYTTMFTHAVDIGIIVPVVYLAGIWLLRQRPLGYLLSFIMLSLLALIGLVVVAQTIVQIQVGITFSTGVLIGMIGSWIVLGLIALWLALTILRHISSTAPELATAVRRAHA
jgi:hypothetical protein